MQPYMDDQTYQIKIYGIVQGVGFRPFIYHLAKTFRVKGQVYNTTEGVVILANFSSIFMLDCFINEIKNKKPEPSVIEDIEFKKTRYLSFTDFQIVKSKKSEEKFQLISPDIATCKACIKDIRDPLQRRYDYAFTNCTNCGPRFTIIEGMPYDRPKTAMSSFTMCPDCQHEYDDSDDRRFHAQPNACPACGPRLTLFNNKNEPIDAVDPLKECAHLLKDGKIIALKSLGGFQIATSAINDGAVRMLRKRKNRPLKPFAVMVKDLSSAKKLFKINKVQEKSMLSSRAPILLLEKKYKAPISELVSGYNDCEGVMLPYTPLHHILFKYLDFPLVMTSANVTEEPIISENIEVLNKLKNICDYFLTHDRKISSKYDDSLVRIFEDKEMVLRRARGYAPYPLKLKVPLQKKTVFGAGSHEKNTFCFLRQKYAIISQHIGDLENYDATIFYRETIDQYKKIFNISDVDCIVYDLHPDYYSSKFAKEMSCALKIPLSHHKAHILSVIAENNIKDDLIGFAWDGTGMGEDGKIWGSEVFFVNKDLAFKRVAHLSEFALPGGAVSVEKPYRMALTLLYDQYTRGAGTNPRSFPSFVYNDFPFFKKIVSEQELDLITKQLKNSFKTPLTTSMGRLFDALSSLLDLTHISSYEGEAAVHLQMCASTDCFEEYKIKTIEDSGKILIDVNDLISKIIYDLVQCVDKEVVSAKFHNTMSNIICSLSKIFRDHYNIRNIALSGGVFQNYRIFERSFQLLRESGFQVYSNFKVPVNDGCVSLGQAFYGSALLKNSIGGKS
jgi:hydrogenase maturation protein HypF